jgi:hypothetical protein
MMIEKRAFCADMPQAALIALTISHSWLDIKYNLIFLKVISPFAFLL